MSTRTLQVAGITLLTVICALAAGISMALADAKADAAANYKKHCALCHGVAGTSMMKNASFTDGKWLHGSSKKEVQAVIAGGVKSTVMLGFSAKLKPEEIDALADFVRAFDKTLK